MTVARHDLARCHRCRRVFVVLTRVAQACPRCGSSELGAFAAGAHAGDRLDED